MIPSRVPEVLYDSETILRLVDSELDELRDDPPPVRVGVIPGAEPAAGAVTPVLPASTSTPDTPGPHGAEPVGRRGRAGLAL